MSAVVVEFPSGHVVRAGRSRWPWRVRLRELITECVASLSLDPPDQLHRAIRSALHELLDAKPQQRIRERSAS